MERHALRDDQFARIEHLLPGRPGTVGRNSDLGNRLFVDAVIWKFRAGTPWRDLPTCFGAWDAVYNRFRRWENRGIWRALFERLPGADLETVNVLLIDSTSIRAHPHAAGAPRKRGAPRRRVLVAAAAASRRNCTSPPRTNRRLLLSC